MWQSCGSLRLGQVSGKVMVLVKIHYMLQETVVFFFFLEDLCRLSNNNKHFMIDSQMIIAMP